MAVRSREFGMRLSAHRVAADAAFAFSKPDKPAPEDRSKLYR
jgi:hypothetical protein